MAKSALETAQYLASLGGNQSILIGPQVVQDALVSANGPTGTNPYATIADIDGTAAALTPLSVASTGTTDSTTSTTGNITTAGGLGVAKAIFAGTTITATTGVVTDSVTEKTTNAGVTVSGKMLISKVKITKPLNTSTVAASALITGAMIASGYIEVTGTTNSSAFDSAANITTAIGTTPIGTTLDFYINTMGGTPMTAGNVLTVTAGANMQFMKQISAGDSASAFLATITATAGVHSGWFRLTYDTATTCSVQRIG